MIARAGAVTSQFVEMIPASCPSESNDDSFISCTKIPYAIYGLLTIAGCVLIFGLPETKDETSPETIEDGNKFGKVTSLDYYCLISKPLIGVT